MVKCPALVFGAALLAGVAQVEASVKAEAVEYAHGGTILEGYLAYEETVQGPRPGVLVVHEWKGLGDYTKRRARQLAELGYVALAVDMYGKGVYAKDHEEAGKLSGALRGERELMRGRILSALDVLKHHPRVDAGRLGAIGYCFGGMAVLELARSGADVAGVASFHGGLSTPVPAKPGVVKAKVLVCRGSADPFVTPEEVVAFEKEMRDAGVDSRLITYEGAVHSFTVPEAGDDPSKGVAYDPEADRRSWEALQEFFQALFAQPAIAAIPPVKEGSACPVCAAKHQ